MMCKYCENVYNEAIYRSDSFGVEDGAQIVIREDQLVTSEMVEGMTIVRHCKIYYCPVCGRKL